MMLIEDGKDGFGFYALPPESEMGFPRRFCRPRDARFFSAWTIRGLWTVTHSLLNAVTEYEVLRTTMPDMKDGVDGSRKERGVEN